MSVSATVVEQSAAADKEPVEQPAILVYGGDLERLAQWGIVHGLGDSAVTLRQLLERAEACELALRLYADRRNHAGVGTSRVYKDNGELARRTLGKCETCRGNGDVATGQTIMDQDGPYKEIATCRICHGAGYNGASY